LDYFVDIFREHGKVGDEELNEAGIINLNLHLYGMHSKDNLTMNRQRTLLLLNPEVVKERSGKLKERLLAGQSTEERNKNRKELAEFKSNIKGRTDAERKELLNKRANVKRAVTIAKNEAK
jgi:hypothetical protein